MDSELIEGERMDVPQMIARASYWRGWCIDHEMEDKELERLRYLLDAVLLHLYDVRDGAGQTTDEENTTPEGIEVKPGQRWRSLDKRDNGRTVTVESVYNGRAHVTNGITRSTLSVRRMRRMSTGWELIGKEQ